MPCCGEWRCGGVVEWRRCAIVCDGLPDGVEAGTGTGWLVGRSLVLSRFTGQHRKRQGSILRKPVRKKSAFKEEQLNEPGRPLIPGRPGSPAVNISGNTKNANNKGNANFQIQKEPECRICNIQHHRAPIVIKPFM